MALSLGAEPSTLVGETSVLAICSLRRTSISFLFYMICVNFDSGTIVLLIFAARFWPGTSSGFGDVISWDWVWSRSMLGFIDCCPERFSSVHREGNKVRFCDTLKWPLLTVEAELA